MPRLGPRTADLCRQILPAGDSARRNRKNRVMSLVAEGFPVPEGRLFELLKQLSDPVMNLGNVSALLRSEPRLGAQILGLLSSSPLEEYHRPLDVSEAVVLLGSERLRILVLGCALADFAGRRLPAETVREFWHHSLLTALLSQRIAGEVRPASADQAYFGGLLHDIGRLPLLIVAREEEQEGLAIPGGIQDSPALERDYFGVDHCEVGRWISCCGNFSPWMSDVLEHHHDPALATQDAMLTAIVAAGDRCCQSPSAPAEGVLSTQPGPRTAPADGDLLCHMRPANLLEEDQAAHSAFLQTCARPTAFPRFGSC